MKKLFREMFQDDFIMCDRRIIGSKEWLRGRRDDRSGNILAGKTADGIH